MADYTAKIYISDAIAETIEFSFITASDLIAFMPTRGDTFSICRDFDKKVQYLVSDARIERGIIPSWGPSPSPEPAIKLIIILIPQKS